MEKLLFGLGACALIGFGGMASANSDISTSSYMAENIYIQLASDDEATTNTDEDKQADTDDSQSNAADHDMDQTEQNKDDANSNQLDDSDDDNE